MPACAHDKTSQAPSIIEMKPAIERDYAQSRVGEFSAEREFFCGPHRDGRGVIRACSRSCGKSRQEQNSTSVRSSMGAALRQHIDDMRTSSTTAMALGMNAACRECDGPCRRHGPRQLDELVAVAS
jgi:hypothetical protein